MLVERDESFMASRDGTCRREMNNIGMPSISIKVSHTLVVISVVENGGGLRPYLICIDKKSLSPWQYSFGVIGSRLMTEGQPRQYLQVSIAATMADPMPKKGAKDDVRALLIEVLKAVKDPLEIGHTLLLVWSLEYSFYFIKMKNRIVASGRANRAIKNYCRSDKERRLAGENGADTKASRNSRDLGYWR